MNIFQIFLGGKYVLTAKVITKSFHSNSWRICEKANESHEAAFWLKALRNDIKYVINRCIKIDQFVGCVRNPEILRCIYCWLWKFAKESNSRENW